MDRLVLPQGRKPYQPKNQGNVVSTVVPHKTHGDSARGVVVHVEPASTTIDVDAKFAGSASTTIDADAKLAELTSTTIAGDTKLAELAGTTVDADAKLDASCVKGQKTNNLGGRVAFFDDDCKQCRVEERIFGGHFRCTHKFKNKKTKKHAC